MKIKMLKNLYQFLCSFFAIVFLSILFMCSRCFAIILKELNCYWLDVYISLIMILLFFLVGWFWIFQIVTIDESGIKISIFNKILKKIKYTDIDYCFISNVARNPVISIKIKNDDKIVNIDDRKKARECLKFYNVVFLTDISNF